MTRGKLDAFCFKSGCLDLALPNQREQPDLDLRARGMIFAQARKPFFRNSMALADSRMLKVVRPAAQTFVEFGRHIGFFCFIEGIDEALISAQDSSSAFWQCVARCAY